MRNPIKTSLIVIGLALSGALAACAPTATSESTGAYVDDAAITTKVKAAIFDDAALKVLDIHVITTKNVVLLTGAVSARPLIARASDVVGKVAGVTSVRNDLVVK